MKKIYRTALRILLTLGSTIIMSVHPMTAGCSTYDYSQITGANTAGASITGYEKAISVNVKELGADNTGAKDSYESIQKALNLATEKATDKVQLKVVIPSGTYKISKPLNVYSNTWIYMKGATIVRDYNRGYMLRNPLHDSDKGGYEGEHNIIIEGGCFDGNTDSTATGFSNIRLGHIHDVWIKDVEFRDNYNGHLIELGGARNVTIENCEFHEYYGDQLKEAIQLDALNNSSVFVSFEPFDDTTCRNIVIRNNSFHDVMRGFGSHSATLGVYFTDIVVSGNTFENIYDRAILMQNYRRTLISDNIITNAGCGIDFRNMTPLEYQGYNPPVAGYNGIYDRINDFSDTVIRNNTISVGTTGYVSEPYCIQLYGRELTSSYYPEHDYKVTGVRIESNELSSPGTTVALYDTEDILIQENSSSSGTKEEDQIIVRQSDNCTVRGNTVKGGVYSGIYVGGGEGHSVTGNLCTDNGSAGIYVSLSAEDVQIKGNNISGSGGSGVKVVKGASAVVEENNIRSAGGAGIEFSDGSGSASNNDISASGGSGIRADGNISVKAKKNKLTDNGGCGVYSMNGAEINVSGNTYDNNASGKAGGEGGGNIRTDKPKTLVCDGVYQDHLQLSWQAVSEADAYSVQRRATTTGEDFAEIAQVLSPNFIDLGLSSRTRYEYRVEGIIQSGQLSFYGKTSDMVSVRTKTDAADCTADLEPVIRFSGKPIEPPFNVYVDGDMLIPDVDYTVKYSRNTAVGTATALVIGKGQYYGFKEFTFEISLTDGVLAESITAHNAGIRGASRDSYSVRLVQSSGDSENDLYNSLDEAKGGLIMKVRRKGGLMI